MRAEIVSIGTELLLGQIVDTHAARVSQVLAECGIACMRRNTVGDNLSRIAETLREALNRADMVLTIGGLGPTQDDLTREAVAAALDEELVYEPQVEEKLRRLFAQRNLTWTDSQKRQAMRPPSARLIDNPNGTAPGMICEKGGKVIIALPGPRGEFKPMVDGPVREYLLSKGGGEVISSRTVRICGFGESLVEQKVLDLMQGDNPTLAPYAHPGEVHLRVTARADSLEKANALITPLVAKVMDRLGDAAYGLDGTTLEEAVLDLLRSRNQTVATGESITGGGLAARFTSVPGSGDAFLGSVVAYKPELKTALLGVPPDLLSTHGPVSAEVAAALARGVREKLGADLGVGLTGNAGPGVDSDKKPVGLVYISVATGGSCETQEHRFRGTREDIRRRTEQAALVLLRKVLLSQPSS